MSEKEVIIFNLVSTYLTKNDGITSRQLQDLVGVSAATARCYLVRFVELGLFQPTGQTKSRHYCLASGMILDKNQYFARYLSVDSIIGKSRRINKVPP